jgi:hypothetical protein
MTRRAEAGIANSLKPMGGSIPLAATSSNAREKRTQESHEFALCMEVQGETATWSGRPEGTRSETLA